MCNLLTTASLASSRPLCYSGPSSHRFFTHQYPGWASCLEGSPLTLVHVHRLSKYCSVPLPLHQTLVVIPASLVSPQHPPLSGTASFIDVTLFLGAPDLSWAPCQDLKASLDHCIHQPTERESLTRLPTLPSRLRGKGALLNEGAHLKLLPKACGRTVKPSLPGSPLRLPCPRIPKAAPSCHVSQLTLSWLHMGSNKLPESRTVACTHAVL